MGMLGYCILLVMILRSVCAQEPLNPREPIVGENSALEEDVGGEVMSTEDREVFDFINALRVHYGVEELLFSSELYRRAKQEALSLSKEESVSFESSEELFLQTFKIAGASCVEELKSIVRKNTAPWLKEDDVILAVAFQRSALTGLCLFRVLLSKGSEGAFSITRKEFFPLVGQFYELPFGYNRDMLLRVLDPFSKDTAVFAINTTAHRVSVRQLPVVRFYNKDAQNMKGNYVRFTFSQALDLYRGFHTKELFLTKASYEDELERLRKIYENDEKKAVYYLHTLDEKLRYAFWMTKDELVELRWFSDGGVFVRVMDLEFPLRFVDAYYKEFGLEKAVSRVIFMRLLKFCLKENPVSYVFEVLNYAMFIFHSARKEREIMFTVNEKRFQILGYFDQNNKLIRQEFRLNNRVVDHWFFRYKNNRLVQIDLVGEDQQSYDVEDTVLTSAVS